MKKQWGQKLATKFGTRDLCGGVGGKVEGIKQMAKNGGGNSKGGNGSRAQSKKEEVVIWDSFLQQSKRGEGM